MSGIAAYPGDGRGGSLVGIVSADDFGELLADELTGLARMVSREQQREEQARKT